MPHHRDESKLNNSVPHGVDPTSPNLIPTSEFTPTDSSSSPNLPGHHLTSSMDGKTNMDASKTSAEDDPEMAGRTKPKIWSLADTATSKSPPAAGESTAGSMMDMLGHCGWFSVNPYQVTTGGFGGYHPSASAAFSSGQCSSSGQGFPQTDTPPQTPPNMKVSGASTNYLNAQGGQLYNSPTTGGMNVNSAIQGETMSRLITNLFIYGVIRLLKLSKIRFFQKTYILKDNLF